MSFVLETMKNRCFYDTPAHVCAHLYFTCNLPSECDYHKYLESIWRMLTGVCVESQVERKDERRRRGDEKTQTSDARFDERFQLAHGLGKLNQPWYAQQGSTLPRESDG